MSPGSFYNGVNKKWGNIKSFQKLYTVFSAKEKENLLSLKPEETTEKKKKGNKNTTKNISGILKSFNKENVTLETEQEEITIERKNISNIKIKFNW